jgi:hypothetical protein
MMPRLASLLAASLVSIAAAAHADPLADVRADAAIDPGPQSSLTVNPALAAIGFVNVAYEHAFWRHASIQVEGVYGTATSRSGMTTTHVDVASITVQPHFYFGERTLEGFYVAPFVTVAQLGEDSTPTGPYASANAFALGSTVGYGLVLGPLDVKLGVGAKLATAGANLFTADRKVSVTPSYEYDVGAALTADLSAGFAF